MNLPITSLLGKYRDLLLAIALFLVIDLGVLVFNYQSSRLIEADTSRINLAGEMRMFSQQLTKAILTLRQETDDGMPTQTSLAQISEAHAAHENALRTLREELGRGKRELFDNQAAIIEARGMLGQLEKTWTPLAESVEPLLREMNQASMRETIGVASNKAVARNIRLMQQADDLTRHLEGMAVERAQQMRRIQVAAILLALANFIFIVFKFLRNLASSDRAAAEARGETERILGTVREGLFLLNREGDVGSQQSASTAELLGRELVAGDDFFNFLRSRMSPEEARAAQEFIALLFNERVKPALMRQLNPLREVAFRMRDETTRHLDFEFQQVLRDGRVEYLLVSVSDITEKVVLTRELAGAEARVKSEVEALLSVLDQDPLTVSTFLDETQERLLGINTALQDVAPSSIAYTQLVNQIARVVHGIKGESGALGLRPLESATHDFEEVLAPLRGKRDIAGDDLIPVAVAMNEMLEEIAKIKRIISRLLHFSTQPQPAEEISVAAMLRQIEQLTLRVAEDLNKKVRFEAQLQAAELPGPLLRALRETLPQLVRNAVAHGIEPADERLRVGKPEAGTIRLMLDVNDAGQLQIAVEDDGRGIDPVALRNRIIDKGLRTADEVARLSDEEVAALMFAPGFSSLDEAGAHAGRGDGLAVVKDVAERLGARLQISSRPLRYTRFAMLFRDNRWLFA